MPLTTVTVKSPGSTMIMGEHAVLHGQPAMVSAIDRYIQLTLTLTDDKQFVVTSDYGESRSAITEQPNQAWAQWLYFIIESYFSDFVLLKNGVSIDIQSTFEGAIGLSSSTAVTVALLYALATVFFEDLQSAVPPFKEGPKSYNDFEGGNSSCYPGFDLGSSGSSANLIRSQIKPGMTKEESVLTKTEPGITKQDWVFQQALHLNHKQNKIASGAALQAIIYGGLRYYDSQSKQSQLINGDFPFYLVNCGYKTPTEEVVQQIKNHFKDDQQALNDIYQQMGDLVKEAHIDLTHNCFNHFYKKIDSYFVLQKQLGVSDEVLNRMIETAHNSPLTHACKISGAGLGDCILVIGKEDKCLWQEMDYKMIIVKTSQQGVHIC